MKDEISGAIKDRLGSNIVGTFTIFFSTLNWKFFTVLFSELEIYRKLEVASEVFWSGLLLNLPLALGFTLVSLLVIPYAKVLYDSFYFERNAESEYLRKLNENRLSLKLGEIDSALNKVIGTKHEVTRLFTELNGAHSSANRINQIGVINQNIQFVIQEIPKLENNLQKIMSDFRLILNDYNNFQATYDNYVKMENERKINLKILGEIKKWMKLS